MKGKQATVKLTDEISKQLRALGVDDCAVFSKEEAVFEALIKIWKETKRPPTYRQIQDLTSIPMGSMSDLLHNLVQSGRILKKARGVFVPVVV